MRGLACKEHLSAWMSEKFKSSGRDRTSKLDASRKWKHDAAFECAKIEVSLQITNGVCHWKLKKKTCHVNLFSLFQSTWPPFTQLLHGRTMPRYSRTESLVHTFMVFWRDCRIRNRGSLRQTVGLGAGNMTRRNIYFALFWASTFRTSIWVSGWTPKIKLFIFSDLR